LRSDGSKPTQSDSRSRARARAGRIRNGAGRGSAEDSEGWEGRSPGDAAGRVGAIVGHGARWNRGRGFGRAGGGLGRSGAGPAGSAGASAASAIVAAGGTSGSTTEGVETEIELAVVKSPIVGTFYRSPEPGAAAFVDVGSSVKKGQVLCIIEAMKLMNEIDSEYDGEVVNVYVESGQAVQYGERLFAIRIR
jgi:acetyl-CoA carboxylase biotin carboxyl carrier protein